MAQKLKALRPSLREKKRYMVFQVISGRPVTAQEASDAIMGACRQFLGELGMSRAGIIMLHDKWQQASQRGMMRISHKEVQNVRAALMLVRSIGSREAVITTKGMSGILRKAVQRFLLAPEGQPPAVPG